MFSLELYILLSGRRHHSRSLESSRQRHAVSDGNLALDPLVTDPPRLLDMRLTGALFFS